MIASKNGIINKILGRTGLTTKLDYLNAISIIGDDSSADNFIINGGFDFWQRGTTEPSPVSGQYRADRFYSSFAGGPQFVVSKATDFTGIAGFRNALKARVSTTGTPTYFLISYKIEGYNYAPLYKKLVTLSFWFKSTIAGTYSVVFRNSALDYSYVAPFTVNTANNWEYKTITMLLNPGGTPAFDNTNGLSINWALDQSTNSTSNTNQWLSGTYLGATGQVNLASVDTNQYVELAGVMLNIGPKAAQFKRAGKTIGGELDLCQRYYCKSFPIDTAPADNVLAAGSFAGGVYLSGVANASYWCQFPTRMRVAPSPADVIFYTPLNASVGYWYSNSRGAVSGLSGGAGNVGDMGFSVTNPQVAADAAGQQVLIHWSASAEL
jgi:hypothetical protein